MHVVVDNTLVLVAVAVAATALIVAPLIRAKVPITLSQGRGDAERHAKQRQHNDQQLEQHLDEKIPYKRV